MTQLRWQSLTKASGDSSAAPPGTDPGSGAPAGAPAIKEPQNSEEGAQLRYWRDRVDEARNVLEYARTTLRQECPPLPPGERAAPDDERYCDRLRREEQAANTSYESLKRDAARAGFPVT